MIDEREELAAAIAEKYLELEELARQAGAYGAMRLDWARYGEDGLDDVLCAFRVGLDDFDRELEGAMSDGDYVRAALENIMDERGMDDAQRGRFMGTVRAFAEQAGSDRLRQVLDGEGDSVMRALLLISQQEDAKSADVRETMDEVCLDADKVRRERVRAELHDISGDAADELLRCYAAYCVLRDGKVEGAQLGGAGLRFIGATVRAGQRQAEALDAERTGRATGERTAEVLRAIAEVLLVALALFVSVGMGVYAGMSVMGLAGLLLGFTGALGGLAMALGLLCALPVGMVVTRDMLKVCARAGVWLENKALEPGAAKLASLIDEGCRWINETVAPAAKQAWDGACAAGKEAYERIKPCVEGAAQGVRQAWEDAKPHAQRAVDDAARWMGQRAGEIGNALDKLMGAFRLDGNADRA